MIQRSWQSASFGIQNTGGSLSFDSRQMVMKNIDYFGYYIRRVSENLRNVKYSFSYERGMRIARFINPSVNLSEGVISRTVDGDHILRQVSWGIFLLEDDMPDSGEVAIIRDGAHCIEEYALFGWQLNEITPISIDIGEKDRILDLIFHVREIYQENSVDKRPIKIVWSERENQTLYIIGDFPQTKILCAVDEGYALGCQKLALKALEEYPQPHNRALIKLFEPESRNWRTVLPQLISENDFVFLTGPRTEARLLQRDAVCKALATPDFSVIQGPPGSGKTTVLMEIIVQEIQRGKRVLLVASTHVAVDNILERLERHGCMKKYGIIPIRIGFEEKISPKISNYLISEAAERERERLLAYYQTIPENERTSAQVRMEGLLRSDSARSELENMIVDSANLVCGTTLGILQTPMIRRARKDRIPGSLFDIMILDEASKTTFPEFLVPAIYCKKFVISGDTNQLTPYCEERDVSLCIGGFFNSPQYRIVCKAIFDLVLDLRTATLSGYRLGRIILCSDDTELIETQKFVDTQLDGLGDIGRRIAYSLVSQSELPKSALLQLISSNLLLIRRDCLSMIIPYLPPWFDVGNIGDNTAIHHMKRRSAYLLYYPRFDADMDTWEQAVAWRLCRKFELHQAEENKTRDRYEAEIEYLMPKGQVISVGDREIADVAGILKNIEHAAFLSILELLEFGFGYADGKKRYVLADGLSHGKSWDSRHTLLKYQWRMHPDIAAFSSEMFYGGNALLSDSKMRKRRNFSYPSLARMVWIDTSHAPRSTDENLFEVKMLLEKFRDFLIWAQMHMNTDGNRWSISLLTFYGRQKELIVQQFREQIYSQFGFTGKYSRYTSPIADVVISTVDRYQGQEADVVFLSFVRNKTGIGFMDSQNRMNVALTRAKYQLYLFGSKVTFGRKSNRIPSWLYQLATKTRCESLDLRYSESSFVSSEGD